jgi:hypothetical protein
MPIYLDLIVANLQIYPNGQQHPDFIELTPGKAMLKPLNILTLMAIGLIVLMGQTMAPKDALGQEIILKNLVLDNVGGTIQLRFGIEMNNLAQLKEYLSEGTTVRLSCLAELQRKRLLWKDDTVLARKLAFDVKNNPLTQQYTMHNLASGRTRQSDTVESLIQEAWSRLIMDLGNWAALPRGNEYALELSVRMIRADVPGWLKKALFFWSWNIGNEQQYRLNFSY